MTQPPQGPPPGFGLPPDAGHAPEGAYRAPDAGYPPVPAYPPPAYPVDPANPPTGSGGYGPVPARPPRRRSPVIAPVLAFIGLLLVGTGSLWVFSFLGASLESADTDGSDGPKVAAAATTEPRSGSVKTGAPAPTRAPTATDAPAGSDEPEVDETLPPEPETTAEPITVRPPSAERADVAGSLLFTRLGGDIWAASGTTMRSLTDSSSTKADSTPTWSPDGKHIYFTRSTKTEVKDGSARLEGKYTLYPTDLLRMKADGSDKKRIFNSLVSNGGKWFVHVLQPSVSPSGNNVAVVSDGNQGNDTEVTLHVINSASGKMRDVSTPTYPRMGHNDPDFNPDGSKIAFTYNEPDGSDGDPKIAVFACRTKQNCTIGKTKYLKSGYANPSYSPKGNLLAVETTDGKGRDIAIITAKGGHLRVRLTNDGDSFSPEFSPAGDQIAYLKRDGLGIDVRIMTLDIDDKGKITLVDDRPVTSDGEVDGVSGLSWYIPKSELARAVDIDGDSDVEASEEPADDVLEGAPPPPPGS